MKQSFVRRLVENWKHVARRFGDFQARVILTFFYFVIVGPFALGIRFCSDPLRIKAGSNRGWLKSSENEGTTLERATKQF